MKIIGNLKDSVEKANTIDEKKQIIAEAGMELSDEEVVAVSGGTNYCKCDTMNLAKQVGGAEKHMTASANYNN